MNARVILRSFGYWHGAPDSGWAEPAARAHVVLDVRSHFPGPHACPELRHLDADSDQVRAAVLGAPGAAALAERIAGTAMAYLAGPGSDPVVIAVGCADGRRTSAVIAGHAARLLSQRGVPAAVTHRDLHRPVTSRTGPEGAAPCLTGAAQGTA